MSKLASHLIPVHWSQQDDEQLRRIQPKAIKIVDPDPNRLRSLYALCPRSLFVLRDWALSEQWTDAQADPVATGIRHADTWKAKLDVWQLPIPKAQMLCLSLNECPVWQPGGIDVAVRTNVAFLDRLRVHGLRGGALNLSVGWPANTGTDTPPDWRPYEQVRAAILRGNHYLVVHGYFDKRGPAFNWKWWAGRHEQCPWQVRILIGEAGLDQFVSDPQVPWHQRGWQGQVNADTYTAQLLEYDRLLQMDRRVHSACIFTHDYGSNDWQSFDVRQVLPRLPANSDFAEPVLEEPMTINRPSNVPADWVLGIDVSQYQGAIDWPAVVASGEVKFAIVRASIGTGYIDTQWERNITGATAAGLLTTAYCVVVPTQSPKAQIDLLFQALRGRVPALPIWLDVEREDGRSPDQIAENVLACANEIQARGLAQPVMYSAAWFFDPQVARRNIWRQFPLAVASYTTAPRMPIDWQRWTFWQYTSSERIPGITANTVDIDVFAGNMEALNAYAGQQPTPPPVPQPPDVDLRGKLLAVGFSNRLLSLNPNAAFQQRLMADGLWPVSGEFSVEYDGVDYGCQLAEHPRTAEVRCYYAVAGKWSDVKYVTK